MTSQEKFIFRFLLVVLVAGLVVGAVRKTWFTETFDTSAFEAESIAVAEIAEARRASLLSGENIISNISLEKVNLNTASKSELITLPGIGPALAERIVAYRDEFGPFTEINELMNVKGIGEKSVARLSGQIELGLKKEN